MTPLVELALQLSASTKLAASLDVKAFEQMAKVNPPPFVTVREEPQATIAKVLE